MTTMNIQRLAAFSDGQTGGNPAGVVIADQLPSADEMQRIAAEVGYSETAFAMPIGNGVWRVRYFSPESEVAFCGHATIALGAALAEKMGDGVYPLQLNGATISVQGKAATGGKLSAVLQSPPTKSRKANEQLIADALLLFGYQPSQLDLRIPPTLAHGGANHLILMLNSREALSNMNYDLNAGRIFMNDNQLVTVLIGYAESSQLFHTRNPFASGGVYEDPATGAATAALAGYLRDIEWPHGGRIEVVQGEDMGARSLLTAELNKEIGSSIRVSGTARKIKQ